ncbi:MAG: integrase arm-type DNA-binding domain-containing protein [Pseudomonadota bacterium]
MPRIIEHQLTDRKIRSLPEGEYLDGRGLSIKVRGIAKSWILRFFLHGRRRRMGLGSYPDVSLAMARERALEARRLVADGIDPIATRREARAIPTFAVVVEEFMVGYRREVKDADRWLGRLKANVWPRLAERRLPEIDRDVISRLLLDIHARAPGTSDKIAQALSRIFRFALGRGYIETNPLEAARAALPKDFGSRAKRPHPMVPVDDMHGFYAALVSATHGRGEVCALALRFLTLTAVRSSELRFATWDEINGELWRIPAERTKTGQVHLVPLVEEATSILGETKALYLPGDLIFPGTRPARPLSDMTLSKRMKALGFKDADGRNAVPHGLRASFKTWTQDHTGVDPSLAERALGHAIKGDVQKAYDRAAMVEKRRHLMERWSEFLTCQTENTVISQRQLG